jgi:DNA repair protein RadA/Sms
MARVRSVFSCTECGAQQPQWHGRCPACGAWSTLVEGTESSATAPSRDLLQVEKRGGATKVNRLRDIAGEAAPRLATGIPELDRVLGGGLVPASVVLIGGEPGVGKSTLALQLAARVQRAGPFLYVSGEESPAQLRLRADRLPEIPEDMLVMAETRVEEIAEPWRERDPSVVLIDSIQTLRTDRVESAPGSVAQVRECAALLAAAAKAHGAALVLIGHDTKDGQIAGPRVLEHLVDVVLNFEGDRGQPFRILRAVKNRFGSTDEVGVFSMGEAGLESVANPSELFLAERQVGTPGSCIVPIVEGTRPMLVEIQALVAPAGYGTARRTSLGIDDGRLALLLAAIDRRSDVDLVSRDVYVNVAGGVRIAEPAADLALALALVSSRLDIALPPDAAACGEIGLGGEIRRVGRIDLRLREAVRLGFRRVLLPAGAEEAARPPAGADLIPVPDVAAAVAWLRANGTATGL